MAVSKLSSKDKKHPLQLEDILDEVFKYLNFEQLMECRQVRSEWNMSSTRIARKKCKPIHFKKWPNDQPKIYSFDKMMTLLDLLQNSFNFPCTKFTIDGDTVSKREAQAIVKHFIETIAPFVTHLQLSDGTTFTPPRGSLASPPLCEEVKFSRLQSITVNLKRTFALRPSNLLPFVGDIVSNAPDLTTVRLNAPTDPWQLTSALSILERIDCSEIRTFSIHGNLQDDHLKRIVDLGLVKVKNLHIQICSDSEMSPEAFQTVLEYQSNTLQNLCVEYSWALRRIIPLKLPSMPKLKTLSIERPSVLPLYYLPGRLSFTEISYIRDLPNLKQLNFSHHVCWNLGEFLNGNIKPIATVQELELPANLENPDVITHVDRIFPRLKKMKIPCSYDLWLTIDRLRRRRPFRSVEELTLVYLRVCEEDDTVDAILSSLPQHFISDWLFSHRSDPNYPAFLHKYTKPVLVHILHNLKVLNIMTEYPGDRVAISEVSVFVMMKLRKLKCVKICEDTARQLTEPMVNWMRTWSEVQVGRNKIQKKCF